MPLVLLEQGAHLQHLRNADERGVRMHPRSHPTALQAGSRCSTKGISKGRATRSSSQASVVKTPSSSAVSPWAAAPRALLAGGFIPLRRCTAVDLACSIVQGGGRACYAVRQRGRCARDFCRPLVVLVEVITRRRRPSASAAAVYRLEKLLAMHCRWFSSSCWPYFRIIWSAALALRLLRRCARSDTISSVHLVRTLLR